MLCLAENKFANPKNRNKTNLEDTASPHPDPRNRRSRNHHPRYLRSKLCSLQRCNQQLSLKLLHTHYPHTIILNARSEQVNRRLEAKRELEYGQQQRQHRL
jgi:hypothetical protein